MAIRLVMLGPPGAGKGTQAERFARERGLPKISTGDILREAVQTETEIGLRVRSLMDRGELVRDDVVIGIVDERLRRDDVRAGFVLDGFPRTVPQAQALDRMMATRDPLIIVDIVVPEAELLRRLLIRMVCQQCGRPTIGVDGRDDASERCKRCGGQLVQRSDDNRAVVLERLKIYLRQTKPLVDYYRTRPTFRSVDGSQPPDAVAADLVAAIKSAGNGLAA